MINQTSGESIIINNQLQPANKEMLKFCQFDSKMNKQNTLTLSGCLPKADHYSLKFAIKSPNAMIKETIENEMQRLSIKMNGNIKIIKHQPNHLKLITERSSKKLSILLTHMMQFSDNLYAQTLALTLGYHTYMKGSFPAGKNAILNILHTNLALNIKTVQLEDGAGLSNNDLLNANFLTNLLYNIQHINIFSTFSNTLPTSGKNGTLSRRLTGDLKGKVHAKTGTNTGVSTLSGYLQTKAGKTYIFSILINGLFDSQLANVHNFQDAILKYLYNNNLKQ